MNGEAEDEEQWKTRDGMTANKVAFVSTTLWRNANTRGKRKGGWLKTEK